MLVDKTGFFEERPGVKSSTRLNSSIIIYCGLLMGFIIIILNRPEFIWLSFSIVATGAGKKVIQKYAEFKQQHSDHPDGN